MDNIQQLTYSHSNNERKKKTIMICDDEQDVLLLFGLVFGSKYHVIMIDSGEMRRFGKMFNTLTITN